MELKVKELLHDIIAHLSVHDKVKDELHAKVDARGEGEPE